MLKRLWKDSKSNVSTSQKSLEMEGQQSVTIYKSVPLSEDEASSLCLNNHEEEFGAHDSQSFVSTSNQTSSGSDLQLNDGLPVVSNNEHIHGKKMNVKVGWFKKLLTLNRRLSFSRRKTNSKHNVASDGSDSLRRASETSKLDVIKEEDPSSEHRPSFSPSTVPRSLYIFDTIDSISDSPIALKTQSKPQIPAEFKPTHTNRDDTKSNGNDFSVKLKNPGRLPDNHRFSKSKLKRELSEEEEKALKRKDILSIMRGKIKLVPEFVDKYEVIEVLGDGAFGFVFAAKILKGPLTGREAAVKFILVDKVSSEGWVFDDVDGYIPFEIHFLRSVQHSNIIQFLDFFKDERFFYLVTELHGVEWRADNTILNKISNPGLRDVHPTEIYKAKVNPQKSLNETTDQELLSRKRTAFDLFECIDVHKRIPEPTCKKIFLGILKAVDFMHQIGFVHRDLKDENVVIDEKYNVKLIDFGSTSRIPAVADQYFDRFNGTLHFASPEILRGNSYRGPEAEIWALGVLLYTIIYGENPFRNPEDILRGEISFFGRDNSLYVDLLKKIFVADPDQRINLENIKSHPWLAGEF